MTEQIQQDDKRTLVLEAALRRFSHFGIAKTTLSEIAEDVHISKANLYYYFSDKWAIVEAIVDRLLADTMQQHRSLLESQLGVEDLLKKSLDAKKDYLLKYRLLIRNLNEVNIHEPRFKAMSDRLFEADRQIVAEILQYGVESSELETMDVDAMSHLYTTAMRGLALYCVFSDPAPTVDEEALQVLWEQQSLFNRVFYKGIVKN